MLSTLRIKGECPRAGTSQLIPHDLVANCRQFRAQGFHNLPKIIGCDPARYGDDRFAIVVRRGRQARILGKYRELDLVELASRIIVFIDQEQPDAVVVDADGVGAGAVDHIKHRNYGRSLFEFHGGMRAEDSNAYYNKRAECWMRMRDWLKAGAEIPDDPELAIDLFGPEYGFSNKNQIQLEKKESMKDRGLASPDLGDALAMTFAVKVAARPKRKPQLIYTFPSANAWME